MRLVSYLVDRVKILRSDDTVVDPLTDDELRASPVGVVGVVGITGTPTVTVSNPQTSVSVVGTVPVSGPLTDTQLRAAAVPVSGTVSVSETRPLVERMLARSPLTGYTLWLDVTSSSATTIYVAEAPVGAVATDSTFRGARVTLDANGAPLGAVATASNFVWNNRAVASWNS